jgi:nitrate/TMAO reductase-like tetraheme cytochrome c subunit
MCKGSATGKYKYPFLLFFFLFFIIPGYSNTFPAPDEIKVQVKNTVKQQVQDSVLSNHKILKAKELIRGERLFYGLAYIKSESVNCAGCHNTRVSDTLNWNPDALEISKKFLLKNANDLSKVLLKPVG